MISIIIPAYNASATLRRCLDSIINQSYKDFEALVVDDGSTDDTYSIIESYAKADNRIVPIRKSNGGVSSARNLALDKAKGDYIAFCDADDEVLPDWLKDFIDNISGVDIVVQDLMIIDSNENRKIPNLNLNFGPVSCEKLLIKIHEVGLIGYLFTKLFRHDIISKINLKFREDIHCREDEVFFLQYMECAKTCFFVPIANYIYYWPASTKIYKSSFTQAVDDLFRSLNRIYNGDLPVEICRCQAWRVKGACVDRLLSGEKLSKEIISIYRQVFDLVLTLSKDGEAFGLVPYESALMDVPFIAPEIGAVKEFVENGKNGLLIDSNNIEHIIDKIEWALNNSEACHKMVQNLKMTVQNNLNPNVMCRNLEKIYQDLINE